MSHSSDFTNGASLEDCRTNFYALFDLSGIKWRRLYADSIYIDPLDDPVLLTYSECISSGVLAAWRRIVNHKSGSNHVQEENNLSYFKEIFIFWYGDEPDFSKLLKSNLHEVEQGSWECGLSYEIRTLFFKALHNAIERGLLSHGYARFGKYFVIPQKLDIHDLNRKQKAIAFNFFIHGESTVCASIDIRVVPAVYILNKLHVTAAQTGHQNVKVILCPYGLTGKLTGSGYKYNDPNMARFLNEWNNFFPHHWKRDQWKMDSDYPHVVEVLVAGARMKYPVSYVFVAEEDHLEAFPHHQPSSGNFFPQSVQPPFKSNYFSADLLTPPMSPNEDPKEKSNRNMSIDSLNKPDGVQIINVSDSVSCIKRSFSEECSCSITTDKSDDNSILWDFQDPSTIFKCVCSRISKKLKKKWGPSSAVHNSLHSNTNQKSSKNEKLNFHHTGIPFHRQKQSYPPDDSFDNTCRLKSNFHADVGSVKAANVNSALPQLQTSVCQPQNESLINTSSDAFYTPAASFDPVMPTLSPQPPVPMIKEEAGSHFLDSSQNNISSSCVESPQAVTLKGKISDEILSPFHTSLLNMFENAKNAPKSPPLKIEVDHPEDVSGTSHQSSAVTNVINSIPQVIEKPCLPKRQYEDSDCIQQPMIGMLYDYQHLDSPLWGPPAMKRIMTAQRMVDLSNDESDVDDGVIVNSHDVKKPVPCIPKDPYEFTDIDETTPSERGFRSSTESFKEEEKFMPFNMPSPVDISPALPAQEITSSSLNETTGKALSPPSSKNFCPKFIREEDLAVSLNDLENIFDTSSSDEENAEASFTPAKLPVYDEFSGKIELSRMYPTPPSLEQNAVPSPYGTIVGLDCAIIENDALRENPESDNKDCLYLIENEEIDVWVPPLVHTFPESPEYSEVELLSPCSSKSDLVYKSSYHPNTRMNYTSSFEDSSYFDKQCMGNLQPTLMLNVEQNNTFYNHENSSDFLVNQSTCDSLSSSNMSFANKSITSSNSNMPQSVVEIHPLIVNLLLSDSLLNTFKDINFSSCSICVCNMNIQGSDAGVILPSSLIPSGNNEPQYKCTCGFSALVHHQKSYKGGLFYEDEVEIYGTDCDTIEKIFGPSNIISAEEDHSKVSPFLSNDIPDFVLDMLRIQCKTMNSSFSLFHKSQIFRETNQSSFNSLEFTYGCEVCFMALEEGKNAMDNPVPSKLDESFKSSCLHKWPYISSPLPATSQEAMLVLDSLKPLLQVSIHKKNTQKLWDVTYIVSGPLTWKEFHRLAPRGTEDQCEPQPIPFISCGHDEDCSILSPFAVRHWDKLDLEPYSLPRDVAYIVVAPENDFILSHVKNFFRELSSCYELHNLGKHRPITKVLRDGIMRVGKTAASKVAEEPVSEWFNSIGDGPVPNKLRLYARVIKHRLAPHLSTLPLDKSIFENTVSDRSSEKLGLSSDSSEQRPNTPRIAENDNSSDNHSSILPSSSQESCEDEEQQPPALVIYIVEPFTLGQYDSNVYRLVTLGLLHSYADMLSSLPDAAKNCINLQLISLDSILSSPGPNEKRNNEIKSLAFSVFSQSHGIFSYQSSVKSLTGFGPAAAEAVFLKKNNNKVSNPLKIYNQPYILASVKDKQTELGEMFGDRRENSGTLYCCYCLSKDKRFIIASCTNDKGEFTETNVINISIPNRHKRKSKSFQKFGLCKLLDFILEVMSVSVHPWRLIIERFGRLGQGELKTWASLLSKKSLHNYSKRLREMCGQCSLAGTADIPCILSVCLVSLEPDATLRLMPDQFTPDDRFSCSRYKTCHLNTPEDASCTHILVFPTSATTQSSQVTFHQEHIDPLAGGLGEDFLDVLNEDINNSDISDLFKMGLGNSPPPESNSQPSSPNAFKHSFSQEGTNQYQSLISDCQEEPSLLLQQPLALGYYVSTAKAGTLPKWFWASCPQLENKSPVYLKCALLIHVPYVQKSSEDPLQSNPQQQLTCHPMDSNYTTDVLSFLPFSVQSMASITEGVTILFVISLNSNKFHVIVAVIYLMQAISQIVALRILPKI